MDMHEPAAVSGALLDFLPILIGFLWARHGVWFAGSVTEDEGSTAASAFAIRRSACGHLAITCKQTTDKMEEDEEGQLNSKYPDAGPADLDSQKSGCSQQGPRIECGIGGKQWQTHFSAMPCPPQHSSTWGQ